MSCIEIWRLEEILSNQEFSIKDTARFHCLLVVSCIFCSLITSPAARFFKKMANLRRDSYRIAGGDDVSYKF